MAYPSQSSTTLGEKTIDTKISHTYVQTRKAPASFIGCIRPTAEANIALSMGHRQPESQP